MVSRLKLTMGKMKLRHRRWLKHKLKKKLLDSRPKLKLKRPQRQKQSAKRKRNRNAAARRKNVSELRWRSKREESAKWKRINFSSSASSRSKRWRDNSRRKKIGSSCSEMVMRAKMISST